MTVRDRILLQRAGVTLHCGDAVEVLRGLPAESVQCCITSPSYYGLRDYGTGRWEGGDEVCDHLKSPMRTRDRGRDRAASGGTFHDSPVPYQITVQFTGTCGKCGARRMDSQIGHEPTPTDYIERLVEVFREVRRVLRGDGTLFVVISDSYTSQGGGAAQGKTGQRASRTFTATRDGGTQPPPSLKAKDLIGIPHMLTFALRDAGWYWRSEIVWAKPNPMPESVTDRCTRSHEFVMMFAKGGRYHHDSGAISEPVTCYRVRGTAGYLHVPGGGDNSGLSRSYKSGKYYFDAAAISEPIATDPRENYPARAKVTGRGSQGAAAARGNDRDKSGGFPPRRSSGNLARVIDRERGHLGGNIPWEGDRRNKRDVWWIPTKASPWGKGLHFASFPEALVEPMILAGSKPGDVVLDPFCGSGTTGAVAIRLGRGAVLIDLNPEYMDVSQRRILAEVAEINKLKELSEEPLEGEPPSYGTTL